MKTENIEHSLAIGDIYFSIQPTHWLFEPIIEFDYFGKKLYWDPDCIFKKGKYYVCEVQLSALSEKKWSKKWDIYNKYFDKAFKTAPYQEWVESRKIIRPRFIAITRNKKAAEGFNIPDRELMVMESIEQLKEEGK